MWCLGDKDRRSLSVYYIVLALLFFLVISRMNSIRESILCHTFKTCYENTDKIGPSRESLDTTLYISTLLKNGTRYKAIRENFTFNKSLPTRKRRILIYSLARSGSSFLGEIFNRREDVFYMYEPLHTMKTFSNFGMFPDSEYSLKAYDMLKDTLHCRFQDYKDHFTFMSYPELCNPHFRLMSKVLSSPPFCRKQIHSNCSEAEYTRNCYTLVPQIMHEFCSRKENVVIKDLVHRLPLQSPGGLSELFKDGAFRMVCLIRDPRAVISSMKNVGGMNYDAVDKFVQSATDQVCQTLIGHYDSLKSPDNYARGRLIAVRYEDIVSQPEPTIRSLFTFLNLKIDPETVQWMIRNTHGGSDNIADSFSVFFRNVSFSLNSWRKSLTFEQIRRIQRKCGDIMRKFGYILYPTRNDVVNLDNPTFNGKIEIGNILQVM